MNDNLLNLYKRTYYLNGKFDGLKEELKMNLEEQSKEEFVESKAGIIWAKRFKAVGIEIDDLGKALTNS